MPWRFVQSQTRAKPRIVEDGGVSKKKAAGTLVPRRHHTQHGKPKLDQIALTRKKKNALPDFSDRA